MSSPVYHSFFFYGLHRFNVLQNNLKDHNGSKAVPADGNTFTQFSILPTVLCSCVYVNSGENTLIIPLCAICIDINMIVARWHAETLYLSCYVDISI